MFERLASVGGFCKLLQGRQLTGDGVSFYWLSARYGTAMRGSAPAVIIHLLSSRVVIVGLRRVGFCAVHNISYPSRDGFRALRAEDMPDRMVRENVIGLAAPARLSVVRPPSQSVEVAAQWR